MLLKRSGGFAWIQVGFETKDNFQEAYMQCHEFHNDTISEAEYETVSNALRTSISNKAVCCLRQAKRALHYVFPEIHNEIRTALDTRQKNFSSLVLISFSRILTEFGRS